MGVTRRWADRDSAVQVQPPSNHRRAAIGSIQARNREARWWRRIEFSEPMSRRISPYSSDCPATRLSNPAVDAWVPTRDDLSVGQAQDGRCSIGQTASRRGQPDFRTASFQLRRRWSVGIRTAQTPNSRTEGRERYFDGRWIPRNRTWRISRQPGRCMARIVLVDVQANPADRRGDSAGWSHG
jgi:hypothetical protein